MRNLIVVFTLIVSTIAHAQSPVIPPQRCATFESLQEFRRDHPNAETDAQFESWLKKKIDEYLEATGARMSAVVTVPVVFHIIHNGEPVGNGSNLSQARIQQQLNQLNADYANLSGSTWAVAANIELQFCLAVVDNAGLPMAEPGINRINRTSRGFAAPPYDGRASNSYVDATIMPSTIWDPYQYFNVWVLDLGSTLLGKATFPASSTLTGLDNAETDTHAGVMLHYASVGSVSSPGAYGSAYGLGRTLTHEAGHFFGLRHIWGDGACATDYCNDTPTQSGSSSGCPAAGTLNGCTPSTARMFQNYMDYTDDPCVNTFTNDQKTRIQTVMLNSPRRKELSSSTVCSAPAGNTIRFGTTASNQVELGVAGGCPRYKDITVPLNIFSAATGDATVTFNTSGTATYTNDYSVIPASLTYVAGDAAAKLITVRILDDGNPESAETVILNYTITGTGVVGANTSQTFTLTITDDDYAPAISSSSTVYLLNENFGTTGGNLPAGWLSGSFRSPEGANRFVIGTNGGTGITGQAAYISSNGSTKTFSYSSTSVSDAGLLTPLLNATGLASPMVSFTYKCLGEQDVNGLYDYGVLMYSYDKSTFDFVRDGSGNIVYIKGASAATNMSVTLPPAQFANRSFYLCFRWVNDNSVAVNPPLLVDNVVVWGAARQVEGELGNAGSQMVFAGQDVFITSYNDDQMLTRINNPSTDLGCVTGTITDAGTGTASITTSSGSFMRTQKVIQISPEINGSTATYQATLYFTSAELAIWGVNKTNLKILKVKDGVSLSGPINSDNAQLITPTSVVENVELGYISYTATFTGFSQFMLVSPTFKLLPVNFLSFNAKPALKHITLTWETGSESNNKGFHVERSSNGTDFAIIGWVNGRGNSTSETIYSFTDRFVQPNIVYYYRLRQVDGDDHQNLSQIRQAKIEGQGLSLSLSPNPAKGTVRVFVSGIEGLVDVQLVDVRGQEVGSWKQVNAGNAPFPIDISGLRKGYYMVIVQHGSGSLSAKLIVD